MELGVIKPDTPCTGVCRMDETTGLCAGCLRTLAEITHWWMMNAAQRRETFELIDLRRAKLNADR